MPFRRPGTTTEVDAAEAGTTAATLPAGVLTTSYRVTGEPLAGGVWVTQLTVADLSPARAVGAAITAGRARVTTPSENFSASMPVRVSMPSIPPLLFTVVTPLTLLIV